MRSENLDIIITFYSLSFGPVFFILNRTSSAINNITAVGLIVKNVSHKICGKLPSIQIKFTSLNCMIYQNVFGDSFYIYEKLDLINLSTYKTVYLYS